MNPTGNYDKSNPIIELYEQGKLPFILHGSCDSLDRDVIYVYPFQGVKNKYLLLDEESIKLENPPGSQHMNYYLPSMKYCHEFCHVYKGAKKENRNVIVIDEKRGVVLECFKGTIDAIQNQIIDTFHNHNQSWPGGTCPLKDKVQRNVILKVSRSLRQLLGFVGAERRLYREQVKKALKSKDFLLRLETFKSIDFTQVFYPYSTQNSKQYEINLENLKSVSFQMAQTRAHLQGIELYSKKSIVQYDARFEPLIYREKDKLMTIIRDPSDTTTGSLNFDTPNYTQVLNQYRDDIYDILSQFQVKHVIKYPEIELFYTDLSILNQSQQISNQEKDVCKSEIEKYWKDCEKKKFQGMENQDLGRRRLWLHDCCGILQQANGMVLNSCHERCLYFPPTHSEMHTILKHNANITKMKIDGYELERMIIGCFCHSFRLLFCTQFEIEDTNTQIEKKQQSQEQAIISRARNLFFNSDYIKQMNLADYHYTFGLFRLGSGDLSKHVVESSYKVILICKRDRFTGDLSFSFQ